MQAAAAPTRSREDRYARRSACSAHEGACCLLGLRRPPALGAAILLGGASPGHRRPPSSDAVDQRGLRRRRQLRRHVHQRLHRAAQPRRARPSSLTAGRCSTARPAGDRRLAGHAAHRHDRRPAALPGRGGDGHRRHRRPADPGRHRHDRDVRHHRQGRAGQRHDRADLQDAADCAADRRRSTSSATATAIDPRGPPPPALTNTTSVARARRAPTPTTTRPTSPPAPRRPHATPAVRRRRTGAGRARPAAHPRHPGHDPGLAAPTASRSPTSPASSPASAPRQQRGFWIQDPTPDADPATSEGLFVFTGSPRRRSPSATRSGHRHGQEFYPASGATVGHRTCRSPRSASPTVIVPLAGNALPGADGGRRRRTVPDTLRARTAAAATSRRPPLDPATLGAGLLGVARGHARRRSTTPAWSARPTGSASSLRHRQADAERRPSAAAPYIAGENAEPAGGIEVVPANGAVPRPTSATCSPAPRSGPVDYTQFGGYTIAATTLGTVQRQRPAARGHRDRRAPTQLAVATYNVENLAPTTRRPSSTGWPQGVVDNLPRRTSWRWRRSRTTTAPPTTAWSRPTRRSTKLTDAIVAAGGPRVPVALDRPGQRRGRRPAGRQHPGGVPVQPGRGCRSSTAPGGNRSTTRPTVIQEPTGTPQLTLSPGRIDPTNAAWTDSRKPLAGEFRFRGQTVFVIANHFDSKGGDQTPTAGSSRRRSPRRCSGPSRRPGERLRRADPGGRPEGATSWSSATSTTSSSPPRDATDADRRTGRPDRPDHDAAENERYTYVFKGNRRCSTTSWSTPRPSRDVAVRRRCTSTPSSPTRSATTTRRWCGFKP